MDSLNYEVTRADQISEPGQISRQIIERINDAAVVIADLSGHNPNVFYELAIRHAINKPVVQLIAKGETIPFDISNQRTIEYDFSDFDTFEAAQSEIQKQINAIESGKVTVDNPISVAIGVKELKSSPRSEDRTLADLLDMVSSLRQEMIEIKQNLPRRKQRYATLEEFPVAEDIPTVMINKDDLKKQMEEMEKTPEFTKLVVQDKEFRKRYKQLESQLFK
jgi:hypothetical protein